MPISQTQRRTVIGRDRPNVSRVTSSACASGAGRRPAQVITLLWHGVNSIRSSIVAARRVPPRQRPVAPPVARSGHPAAIEERAEHHRRLFTLFRVEAHCRQLFVLVEAKAIYRRRSSRHPLAVSRSFA